MVGRGHTGRPASSLRGPGGPARGGRRDRSCIAAKPMHRGEGHASRRRPCLTAKPMRHGESPCITAKPMRRGKGRRVAAKAGMARQRPTRGGASRRCRGGVPCGTRQRSHPARLRCPWRDLCCSRAGKAASAGRRRGARAELCRTPSTPSTPSAPRPRVAAVMSAPPPALGLDRIGPPRRRPFGPLVRLGRERETLVRRAAPPGSGHTETPVRRRFRPARVTETPVRRPAPPASGPGDACSCVRAAGQPSTARFAPATALDIPLPPI